MGSLINGILPYHSAMVIALDHRGMLSCSDREAEIQGLCSLSRVFFMFKFLARIRRDGIHWQSGDFTVLSCLTDHFKQGDFYRFCQKTGGFLFVRLHVRPYTVFLQIVHALPVLVKHEQ